MYFILLAGLLAVIWASYRSFGSASSPSEKPLSDLLLALDGKQVVSGTFNSDGDRVDWKGASGDTYRTVYPVGYQLVDRFHAANASFTVTQSSSSNVVLSVILPNVILFVVIGAFMWYMLRMAQRSKAPPPPA